MAVDSDVVLLGNGVAALVAANHFAGRGKSVLLLNPDWDFFRENSELPLDPLLPLTGHPLSMSRIQGASSQRALDVLRPDFPGAVEHWPKSQRKTGFHDKDAPHVRSRARLWIRSIGHTYRENLSREWERLEEMYLEVSDTKIKAEILDGIPASARFPGFSSGDGELRGVLVPNLADVDVNRYRNGMLDFVRERLGEDRVVVNASQVELIDEGIRFRTERGPTTARVREGVCAFWTPRLSSWITHLYSERGRKKLFEESKPRGARFWEEWVLVSREPLDPTVVGIFEDMVILADSEGYPDENRQTMRRMGVLRGGEWIDWDNVEARMKSPEGGMSWVSQESFSALERLSYEFLNWDKFSVSAVKPRLLYEWDRRDFVSLDRRGPMTHVFLGSDGPLVDVVDSTRRACDKILSKEN